jgi:hypothetical protein
MQVTAARAVEANSERLGKSVKYASPAGPSGGILAKNLADAQKAIRAFKASERRLQEKRRLGAAKAPPKAPPVSPQKFELVLRF